MKNITTMNVASHVGAWIETEMTINLEPIVIGIFLSAFFAVGSLVSLCLKPVPWKGWVLAGCCILTFVVFDQKTEHINLN